jgi:hypothetical protein
MDLIAFLRKDQTYTLPGGCHAKAAPNYLATVCRYSIKRSRMMRRVSIGAGDHSVKIGDDQS